MLKPEIGLSMLYCLGQPFKKMLENIPKTGTACIEIVDDGLHSLNRQRVSELRGLAKSHDLKYTIHAPFAGINIAIPSKLLLNATLRRLRQSIINASKLDCQLWVFHPGMKTGISMFYPGKDWLRNLTNTRQLVRFAHDNGVEAAVENVMEPFVLKNTEDFKRFYSEFDEDLGLALDTGHANMNREVEAFLVQFPRKITHLHAHDNLGETDQHLGIGFGNIDWIRTADLLKKISYERIVMVESVEHVGESVQKLKQLLN